MLPVSCTADCIITTAVNYSTHYRFNAISPETISFVRQMELIVVKVLVVRNGIPTKQGPRQVGTIAEQGQAVDEVGASNTSNAAAAAAVVVVVVVVVVDDVVVLRTDSSK